MAQTPARTCDFSLVPSTSPEVAALADAALLLLGTMASYSSDLLAAEGWEVADDGTGKARYVHQQTAESRPDPPKLLGLRAEKGPNWSKTLLLELPAIVAPFVRGPAPETPDGLENSGGGAQEGELVWPARVLWHESQSPGGHPVTVIDILEENEEEGIDMTTRALLTGVWQGMFGPRHSEMDIAYPPGSHLESWNSVTLAGIGLLSSGGKGPVLSIGLGGGVVLSFLKRHTTMDIHCVEPNPSIASMAQKWFGFSCLPSRPHSASNMAMPSSHNTLSPCHLSIFDVPAFLKNTPDGSFPTILVDLNVNGGFPSSLLSSEFFRELRRILQTSKPSAIVAISVPSSQERERVATFMRMIFPVTRRLVDGKSSGDEMPEDAKEDVVMVGGEGPESIANLNVHVWKQVLQEVRQASPEAERMPFTCENMKDNGEIVEIRWGGNWDEPAPEDVDDGSDHQIPQLVPAGSKQSVMLGRDDPAWSLFD